MFGFEVDQTWAWSPGCGASGYGCMSGSVASGLSKLLAYREVLDKQVSTGRMAALAVVVEARVVAEELRCVRTEHEGHSDSQTAH